MKSDIWSKMILSRADVSLAKHRRTNWQIIVPTLGFRTCQECGGMSRLDVSGCWLEWSPSASAALCWRRSATVLDYGRWAAGELPAASGPALPKRSERVLGGSEIAGVSSAVRFLTGLPNQRQWPGMVCWFESLTGPARIEVVWRSHTSTCDRLAPVRHCCSSSYAKIYQKHRI